MKNNCASSSCASRITVRTQNTFAVRSAGAMEASSLRRNHRIHGESLRLGIEVSERTISRFLPKGRRPPSQTWRSFLDNHVKERVSIDFLTVPTATFRLLYVLIVLAHDRRRIVHFNVTGNPTAAWTAQQMIEAF